MKSLILGGMRSGKSHLAESRVAHLPDVTYVACGPTSDDADWAGRIARHQARRPSTWATQETADLPAALAAAGGPVLVDCLGTWLTAHLDALAVWEAPREDFEPALEGLVEALVAAVTAFPFELVVVTNEVGLTLVPEHRSGRIFADWLGMTNRRVADACDRVDFVVAGQVLPLKQP